MRGKHALLRFYATRGLATVLDLALLSAVSLFGSWETLTTGGTSLPPFGRILWLGYWASLAAFGATPGMYLLGLTLQSQSHGGILSRALGATVRVGFSYSLLSLLPTAFPRVALRVVVCVAAMATLAVGLARPPGVGLHDIVSRTRVVSRRVAISHVRSAPAWAAVTFAETLLACFAVVGFWSVLLVTRVPEYSGLRERLAEAHASNPEVESAVTDCTSRNIVIVPKMGDARLLPWFWPPRSRHGAIYTALAPKAFLSPTRRLACVEAIVRRAQEVERDEFPDIHSWVVSAQMPVQYGWVVLREYATFEAWFDGHKLEVVGGFADGPSHGTAIQPAGVAEILARPRRSAVAPHGGIVAGMLMPFLSDHPFVESEHDGAVTWDVSGTTP